jgi:hypothetical protein
MKKYTPEQESNIKNTYVADPRPETVQALAEEYEVPVRSIIAKLSHFNVYKAKRYMTKQGELPRKKAEMIMDLAPWFKYFEIEQFEKLSKPVIAKLTSLLLEYENYKNQIAEADREVLRLEKMIEEGYSYEEAA